jgi:PhnB protein
MKITTTITPFLVVDNGAKAVEFYKKAFGARLLAGYDRADGKLTAKMSIDDAVLWLGDEEPEFDNLSPSTIGGSGVRIALIVSHPETVYAAALEAGATQICPVTTEEYYKIGKLKDPFGHIWEIGHPLGAGSAQS